MTDGATLRPAMADDVPAIAACAEAAYRKYVARIGKKPAPMTADFAAHVAAGEAHVLTIGERLGAYIVMREGAGHLFVENIAVDPGRQGAGLGTRLIAFAEAVAREQGLPEIRLYTNVKASENFAFYRSLGFTETGRRREHGFDRVYLMKPLAGANRGSGVS